MQIEKEMKTEKLYYIDSHMMSFTAKIISCEIMKDGKYGAVLDRTAFFPEGGGQSADTGNIAEARVLDVHEKNGTIVHTIDRPLEENGAVLSCRIDEQQRRRRMQNHSGEHVVSGLVNKLYGFDNVGFHMGETCMTIDFSGELTWQQILEIEKNANEVVRADIPVRTFFPQPEELKNLEYRSKLDLTENVRIVEIEGVDRCACCAPHVGSTGEIGIVKILSCEKHRGGIRIEMVCGMDALDQVNAYQKSVTEISNLLSAKRAEVSSAVEHLIAERDALKEAVASAEKMLIVLLAETVAETSGNLVMIRESFANEATQRELVNLMVPKCGGMAGVFCGNDQTGYRYVIGSANTDLRAKVKEINAAISGRGGGKPEMIMGSCSASAAEIKKFFA